jgi:Uma2 family endonuclease
MATPTVMTGEDLLRMPGNGKYYELVQGKLRQVSPPGMEHGERAVRIGRLLDEFVEDHELGRVGVESGFYLNRNPDTVRGPDAFFVSKERLPLDVEVVGFCEVMPDLVVEVVSPGDTFTEVMEKVQEYLDAGVRLVWVVDSRRRALLVYPGGYMLAEKDTLTGGEVLPGFAVPIVRLFRRRQR